MPDLTHATYRLQLSSAFTFEDAAGVADYLAELGVTHVYCSPVLQATPGSTHGYDVTDPTRVNSELGGDAGFARFVETLRAHGLKLLLDVVPNHMAVGEHNPWWQDVLENGPASRYADFFDVDWQAAGNPGRILLPTLGDQIGRVLDAGQVQLSRDGGHFAFEYFERSFPAAIESLGSLLGQAAEACGSAALAELARRCGELQKVEEVPACINYREEQHAIRQGLATLFSEQPATARAGDESLAAWNADPGKLDALLCRQYYRLAFWRLAREQLGYRRFFDIVSLVGLRVEDEETFTASHALVLRWLHEGLVHGLRIDHPDGLRDPEGYLRRLRRAAPEAWIVVEKIVEPGEHLPSWPVEGMTGYDFMNQVGGLFVDPRGERALTDFYQELTGASVDFPEIVRSKKLLVLREVLGGDVNRLLGLLSTICRRHRRHRDYTRDQLTAALREVAACFPVYRSYVRPRQQPSSEDEQHVSQATEAAKRRRPELDPELFDFLRDLLLLRIEGEAETEFALRFQQLTGPAMAKGVEDTAFYCFNRLIALNEVGGDPGRFGVSVAEFHRFCARSSQDWPRAMLATSTHDTKRGEDVRARIALLSERSAAWIGAVRRWVRLNERHRHDGWPDRNAEYLFYQTLFGAWPIEVERVTAYMQKASREAKEHTTWTDPNPAYESAMEHFVKSVMADEAFIADFDAFVQPFVRPGRINSLAQTLLKLTAPGVPDIYQGTELWSLTLVDPDNRRPVDYERRRRLLEGMRQAVQIDPERGNDARAKLWVTRQALAVRRRCPAALGPGGSYEPLEAHGPKAGHVVAFLRGRRVVTAVPRLVMDLDEGWSTTALLIPDGRWKNELTGEAISGGETKLAQLTARFPLALLSREED